jgi:hypothetical protein
LGRGLFCFFPLALAAGEALVLREEDIPPAVKQIRVCGQTVSKQRRCPIT